MSTHRVEDSSDDTDWHQQYVRLSEMIDGYIAKHGGSSILKRFPENVQFKFAG